MFEAMPEERLLPDYDSYSAVITSYLKESVRAFRQFAASHPGGLTCSSFQVIRRCDSQQAPLIT